MLIFIIYILILSLFSIRSKINKIELILLLTLLFPLFLIGFLRFNIGTDWNSYIEIYDSIKLSSFNYELGWVILNIIAYHLGDFQYVIILGYLIIFLIIINISYKNVSAIFLLSTLSLFRLGIYFTRIEIACFIILIALYNKNSNIKSIIILLSACLFHWSALVFLGVYFFWICINKRRYISIMFILLFLIYIIIKSKQAVNSINIHMYEVQSTYNYSNLHILLKSSSLFTILYILRNLYDNKTIKNTVYTLLIFTTLGSLYSPGIERLFVYIYPIIIKVMTNTWNITTLSKRILCILILLSIFAFWLFSPFQNLYFPIKTILDT
jgi:hypothetical protein